jgi:ABC-type amino acid transport substrate-binding protein
MRRSSFDAGRRRWLSGAAAAAAAAAAWPLHAEEGEALARIRARGSLVAGVYRDMPPFCVAGKGIDVEVARALASQLGLGLSLLPFAAGESMEDDLRNVVWRGHYLGWGPADVMLHVPQDASLLAANPRVRVVAPYYRERVAIALRRDVLPSLDTLASLRGQRVAVAGRSLAGWLLIGAEDGALTATLSTGFEDGTGAAQALREGQVVAAAGLQSELESVLSSDSRFAIQPLPSPRAPREGWAIGCAVKKEAGDLASALEQAMPQVRLSGIFERAGVQWRV